MKLTNKETVNQIIKKINHDLEGVEDLETLEKDVLHQLSLLRPFQAHIVSTFYEGKSFNIFIPESNISEAINSFHISYPDLSIDSISKV